MKEEYIILRQDDRYPIPEGSKMRVFPTPIKVFCARYQAIKLAEYLCGPGMEYEYYVYGIDY